MEKQLTTKGQAGFRAFLNGEDEESERLFQEVLQKRLDAGQENLELASAYHDLAQLYYAQGEYNKAESYFQNELSVHEKLKFVDGTSAGLCLSQLADVYRIKGKYSDAESLLKRSIELCERDLGAAHPALPHLCLEPYARLLSEVKREAEAEVVKLRMESIKTKGS